MGFNHRSHDMWNQQSLTVVEFQRNCSVTNILDQSGREKKIEEKFNSCPFESFPSNNSFFHQIELETLTLNQMASVDGVALATEDHLQLFACIFVRYQGQ